jgi:hypothetical protein
MREREQLLRLAAWLAAAVWFAAAMAAGNHFLAAGALIYAFFVVLTELAENRPRRAAREPPQTEEFEY